jgi:hypothetical protein
MSSPHSAANSRLSWLADFDERLWPIHGVLGFLVGLITLVAIGDCRFDDPRLIYNAWLRVGVAVAVVLVLIIASFWLRSRAARRVLFCMLLSVLVHVGFGVFAHYQHLPQIDQPAPSPQTAEESPPEPPLSDFKFEYVETPPERPAFEEPVEVELPAVATTAKIARQESGKISHPLHETVAPEPPPSTKPLPAPLRPTERELPLPELASASPMIRREKQPTPVADAPIPQPVVLPSSEVAAGALNPSATAQTQADRKAAEIATRPVTLSEPTPTSNLSVELARLTPRPGTADKPLATPPDRSSSPARSAIAPPAAQVEPIELPTIIENQSNATFVPAPADTPQTPVTNTELLRVQKESRQLDAMTAMPRLPVAAAPRQKTPSASRPDETSSAPTSLARAPAGIDLPSAIVARLPDVQLPPPPGTPSNSRHEAPAPVAIPKSRTVTPPAADVGNLSAAATSDPRFETLAAPFTPTPRVQAVPPAATRSPLGPLLAAVMPRSASPATASVSETAEMASLGAGGLVPGTGTAPSTLEPGSQISVQRHDPLLPAPSSATAANPSKADLGDSPLPYFSGPTRPGNRGLPVPAVAAPSERSLPIGRSTPGPSAMIAGEAEQTPVRWQGEKETTSSPFHAQAAQVGKREPSLPTRTAGDALSISVGTMLASIGPMGMADIPTRRPSPPSTPKPLEPATTTLSRVDPSLSIESHAIELPAEPFRNRNPITRKEAAIAHGATDATEQAVERGLAYLAHQQFPDGHWSLERLPADAGNDAAMGQMRSNSAATGLALLAFLGAGYTHHGDKHRDVVQSALRWLVDHQKPDGDLFSGGSDYVWFYSHGIASIALCEALGMARDPALRAPARRAIRFIETAQHPQWGGWRYQPQTESDTSVSGWQLMAMKSAQMAGLDVSTQAVARVNDWLNLAQAPGTAGGLYVYNPQAANTPEQATGRIPNRAMTAEGVLMRMYLGWNRQHPGVVEGARFIVEHPPEFGTEARPLRDAYYWYYATQVMFHMQSDYWPRWRDRLFPLLEQSQLHDGPYAGSWDPQRPIPDRWADAAGRHYVTTMNLLMLEVTYRHLPLFRDLTNHPASTRQAAKPAPPSP